MTLTCRQGEPKDSSLGSVPRRPYPSPMCLDDRAADRQSHAHAAGFGSEEGVEQPVRVLGGNPDTAVFHCYQNLACFVLMRSDHQFARPVRDRLHRLDAVHYQIDNHMLQLDPISEDGRWIDTVG